MWSGRFGPILIFQVSPSSGALILSSGWFICDLCSARTFAIGVAWPPRLCLDFVLSELILLVWTGGLAAFSRSIIAATGSSAAFLYFINLF